MNQKRFKFILVITILALCAIFLSARAWSFDRETSYVMEMYDNLTQLGNTIDVFNSLLVCPEYDDLWCQRMGAVMYLFEDISGRARNINPPKAFARSHACYMRAMDELDAFRLNFVAGFDAKDRDLIMQARDHWDKMYDFLKLYSETLAEEIKK